MSKVIIDFKECIGCNLCVDLCPKIFESTEFVPKVLLPDAVDNQCVLDAIDFCPVMAISVSKVD